MKTYYLNIKSVLVVALLCGIFWSCQEEEFLQDDLATADDNFGVKEYNGYLWFKDTATYLATLKKLEGYSREELDQWEEELGFTSIRFLFEKAVDEDEVYFEELENMEEEEVTAKYPNGVKPHSSYVLNNAELFNFHEEGWFEPKTPISRLNKVLNKDGLVRIGGKIVEYSSNAVKIILDGDEKKIPLLDNVSESQFENSIRVDIITFSTREIIPPANNAKIYSYPYDKTWQVNTCTKREDRYRVRLRENITTLWRRDGYNGPYTRRVIHTFEVNSFRHTYQGWQRRFKTSSLGATIITQTNYGSGTFSDYVQAATEVHTLGAELFNDLTPPAIDPEIYYSQGEAWGRNGCRCSYASAPL